MFKEKEIEYVLKQTQKDFLYRKFSPSNLLINPKSMSPLGSGAYSFVFDVYQNYYEYFSNCNVVIKEYRKEAVRSYAIKQILMEIKILKYFRSSVVTAGGIPKPPSYHVVELLDVIPPIKRFYTNERFLKAHLVLKKYPMDLNGYIDILRDRTKRNIRPQETLEMKFRVLYLLSTAIYELFVNGIILNDLKPDNVLVMLDKNGFVRQLKICDFNGACFIVNPIDAGKKLVCTFTHRPPEYNKEITYNVGKVSPKGDVWSLVICFFEVLDCCHPFFTLKNWKEAISKINPEKINFTNTQNFKRILEEKRVKYLIEMHFRKSLDNFFEEYSKKSICPFNPALLFDLITKMIKEKPTERIGIKDVVYHPLFARFRELDSEKDKLFNIERSSFFSNAVGSLTQEEKKYLNVNYEGADSPENLTKMLLKELSNPLIDKVEAKKFLSFLNPFLLN